MREWTHMSRSSCHSVEWTFIFVLFICRDCKPKEVDAIAVDEASEQKLWDLSIKLCESSPSLEEPTEEAQEGEETLEEGDAQEPKSDSDKKEE